jgi:hypothetical protein
MNHITITDSYYALACYRCGNILFLPAKTVTFQPLPSDFTVGPYWRRILFYTLARPVFARFATPFYPAPFFISRDFTSSFREISLHCYERFHFIVVRDYNSMLREITLHHYERLHFIVTRDYTSLLWEITIQCYERLSIWIIQPAVRFDRRFESTERFIHSLDTLLRRLSLLYASRASPVHSYGGGSAPQRRLLICRHTTPPSIFTLRDFVAAFAGPFLRRLCDLPFLYFRFLHYDILHFIVIEITLHCYERLHFIITRDYTSLLRDITLHCYEILHFIVTRYYTSLLREIKYLNYTTRRLFLP